MTRSDNPLLSFSAQPRYGDLTPQCVEAAVDAVLADATQTSEAVSANTAAPTWENVMAPLEDAGERISRVWSQVEHFHSVMSSPAWRQAHQDNLAKIAAFFARMGQHEGVYARVRALADSEQFATLSAGRRKIVRDHCQEFELSGVALPAADKDTFRHNSEELAQLGAQFEEHLLEATKAFALTVQEEDLGDMPADLRAIAAAAAQQAGESGYRFTLQPPSYLACMQYVSDRAAREKMYEAYVTRASEFGPAARDNTPLVAQIVEKRQQQAALLGYANYAEAALQMRMAPNAAAVTDFLHDLLARAKPPAEREMEELRQFAEQELHLAPLQAWDVNYASEKLCRAKFDFSDADLRPYLREDKILSGLFACLQQLFGVTLREQEASVWHEDVRFMQLVNADGAVIGGVYLDLYARDDKRGGAWMADALSRFRRGGGSGDSKGSGALQLPLAHVTCNFSKPVADGVALLNWDEVVTLFHEFGHAVHHLLTEVEEYSASGISGVEWDAVELPSQWLENFVWEWEVLQGMTAHCDTGEPMPQSLFNKALAARRFQSGMWLMRQLEFALFDMALHDGVSLRGKTALEVLAEVRQHTALLPPAPYNRFYCGFSHIFAGGYAAGYYSYLWAEVLAADIFMLFKEQGGSVLNRELGEVFRREVLAVGGSRAAMDSFIAVRGRAPESAPLLAQYGLAA